MVVDAPLSINNEWYTPDYYVDAAREVLGGIDLDPASCALANMTVQADKYYAIDDDGLKQQWHGRIWLNPPFAAAASCPMPQLVWGSKLVREYQKRNVKQAVLLIMAASKQKWFHELWAMSDFPVCFNHRRLYFNRPDGSKQELREGTCAIYLGSNEARFIEIFSQFGTITRRVGGESDFT